MPRSQSNYFRSCVFLETYKTHFKYFSSSFINKMNFTLPRAIIVAVILGTAQAAHIAACTENKDGTGPYAADATKACCENQAGNANINGYYDSDYGDCRTGITGGNKDTLLHAVQTWAKAVRLSKLMRPFKISRYVKVKSANQ
ncbi:hypothetical protein E3Q02_04462 [Wallemia mellicola]|uniref:Uncharacterized protein n=1 Tax=Wallemia mellicola TaxID=1708541 RepID=A0AB38MRR6_9BASI|nr:hypothetical protein E3Q02_04462 [Wallemia mellicola]